MLHITAANISCQRGGVEIFSNLSFELKAGSFVALRGPNGAGKSSLLRLLAGLNTASSGILKHAGGGKEQPLGEQCHYIAHQDAIKPSMTVLENLNFWAKFFDQKDFPKSTLDTFSMNALADVAAGQLSAGQKRRLALSRLIVAPRTLWLLDEPSVGLDERATTQLETAIANHRKAGGIILASTHVSFGIEPDQTITLTARKS